MSNIEFAFSFFTDIAKHRISDTHGAEINGINDG